MRTLPLIRISAARFRPSNWGALPLFLGLLLLVRWALGGPVFPRDGHFIVGAALHLMGFFTLTPAPWLWTGDDRHRPEMGRGTLQALVWNLAWLGLFSWFHATTGGPEPPRVSEILHRLAGEAALPAPVLRVVLQLPFACLAGWFLAEMDARGLDRAQAEGARRELERQARESQAQALRAQLDPHVLYNALGALSELVRENPSRAEEALLDFSDFYRRLTRMRDLPSISLADERSLLEQYLAMESLRLGPRLSLEWDWPEALGPLQIPPLLVLPLVENAIKHGLAPDLRGGILRVEARQEADGLRIHVRNQGCPLDPKADSGGTGLSNLRARLGLVGQGRSRLELHSQDGWTVAELHLTPDVLGDAP